MYTYFDNCRNSLDAEKKIIQQIDNKQVLKEDLNKLNEQLGKSMKLAEINELLYKTEIDKMNKFLWQKRSKYNE